MTKLGETIDEANAKAAERMMNSQPVLVDIKPAISAIPKMEEKMILHAGPPVEWERMCGPVRGAVIGALIFEGLAESKEEAEKLAASGEIKFEPCHHHSAVGPMTGVVSSSMPVFCVKNETYGNTAYCTLNEGLGKVLRFGAYDGEVIKRLGWMREILVPALRDTLELSGGINLKNIITQALMMGDECHNRNVAGTSLFLREITPHLLETENDKNTIKEIISFISGNNHFFLNLSMPACKATADTVLGMKYSTLMCAMARNGTEIGIRIAGLGERWFTAPAGMPKGLYFPGYSEKDANPDLGDSSITETASLGGFAMASAPAIVKFIGGSAEDAIKYTREMYEITVMKHRDFKIPSLDFAGTPLGVDMRKVIETGLTPIINTGIAHKEAGVGQVGAGILYAPIKPFEDALVAFDGQYA